MSRAEDLLALADRCERATGPDREIDEALHELFDDARMFDSWKSWTDRKDWNEGRNYWGYAYWKETGFSCNFGIPKRSVSLDAAVALLERVLPGWGWIVAFMHDTKRYEASTFSPDETIEEEAEAPSGALALVAATLRALAATPPADAAEGE